MKSKVDVLAVIDGNIAGMEEAIVFLRGAKRDDCVVAIAELREARAAVAELIAFVENIAKPYSDPMNSLCVSKKLEVRRHWMGEIRRSARAALARCGGAQ